MNEPHDTIDDAFANLRDSAIPDGPSPQVFRKTLAAARAASRQGHVEFWQRFTAWRQFFARAAKPIAAGIGILVIAVVAIIFLRSPVASYAQIVGRLTQAHLVRYEELTESPGSQPLVITRYDSDQGIEIQLLPDQRNIIDYRNNCQRISLFPLRKTAYVQFNAALEGQPTTLLDDFKAMAQSPSKDLGAANIDGHATEEFQVQRPGPMILTASAAATSGQLTNYNGQMTTLVYRLWADRQTGDLVRVERTMQMPTGSTKTIFRNFVLDPQVTPADVSTDIPPDYHQIINAESTMKPADFQSAVVQFLRSYAASHNGQYPPDGSAFPPGVIFKGTDAQFNAAAQSPHANPAAATLHTGEVMVLIVPSTAPSTQPAALNFAALPPVSRNVVWAWSYFAGKSASDRTALILWFKDGNQFRGIYGDLSVRELSTLPQN